jgi:serine/threonine protein kinase/tetratricopeptide (TPR) repeat protein
MESDDWDPGWPSLPEESSAKVGDEPSSVHIFRDFDFGNADTTGRWDVSGNPGASIGLGQSLRELAPRGRDASAEPTMWANPGQAAGLRPAPTTGRTRFPDVPGYEILEELGRGGMGVVYKARLLRLNRVVALKMILAGDHSAPDALARFLTEAETIARLQHANIVQIYSIGDNEGLPYIELEYVVGGSLASRLDGTPWPSRSAARLAEKMARAVAEAHRLGIVHRDLKPANILMTEDGEPKVTDFGLAKTLERDSGLTRTESILGSPSYMAPEQAEGRTSEVGTAADVYALGANLYELLTGRPPFVASSVLATLDLVKNTEPVPPRRLQPLLERDLETICLKCLEKEPERRYESAEALADDLAAFLADEPIKARPTAWWERAFKWVRRRPSTAGLIAVSAAVVLASLMGLSWYRHDQSQQREAALHSLESLRGQSDQFLLLGREAIRRRDWAGARTQLSSARALLQSAPSLAGTLVTVEELLALSRRKIVDQESREAARARFKDFLRLHDEAVFYQSDYTGLDPEANLRASRNAARSALTLFGLDVKSDAKFALDPTHFDAREAEGITSSCYELILILAEAVSQPMKDEDPIEQASEALSILENARRIRTPTATFYLRGATYLDRLGKPEASLAERRKAETAVGAADSAVDWFLAGEEAYRKKDLKTAVESLRHTLVLQPDHFWAQYLLAICHLKAHRPGEAQAALTACQSRRPGFVWTYLLKGFTEGEMREFDLAETDFRRAGELGLNDQERYVMLVNRGVMRIRREWNSEATEDLRAAIALKPDQFQAYINLAQALQNLKRWDEAVGMLDRAITLAPGQAVLYRARAHLLRLRSRDPEALKDLDRAIELSRPDDPLLADDQRDRGLILHQAGRLEEALDACDRAMALQPKGAGIHRLRGVVLMALRRYAEATRSFDICLAGGQRTAAVYEARGLALANQGSYARAIADYTLAMNTGHPTSSLNANRGWAYLFSGASELAARDFDESIRLEPSNGHALNGRALANVQLRKPHEAVADAQAAVLSSPDGAREHYTAARVFCQASACVEADPSRQAGTKAAARDYRTKAVALLARSVELLPQADRARFWTDVVRTDAAFEPIRRSTPYLNMDTRVLRQTSQR